MKSCAFTGHRNLPADFDMAGLSAAVEELLKEGYDRFYCGMAMGFDLAALSCLMEYRVKYNFTAVACIPHPGQEKSFPPEEKEKYYALLALCDERVVCSEGRANATYLIRDRYMVDRADLVFGYCRQEKGGTAYTISYAKRKKIPVRVI